VLALAGCGGGKPSVPPTSASSGQVAPPVAGGMTRFAAARAADQVSFGATPALVDQLAQQGLPAWITAQMALPASQMTAPPFVYNYELNDQVASQLAYRHPPRELLDFGITAPDQLRLRVSWALLQYVPINTRVQGYGQVTYFNMLQQHAFGNYADFLRAMSIHPSMGFFLDNAQNRPTSDQCASCAPNENFARELLQLFSLGVVKLNQDGTVQRDGQGKPVETYTQEDVEQLASAFTGWRFAPSATPLPGGNWFNAALPMVPETWQGAHDRSAKTVMGVSFPAGRSAPQELETIVSMLMAHQNIAPFVSLRLIQHLVTSNPTPAYIGRVAAVFRNNGQGVAGDMKAVIRAILTDVEARRGDTPGADTTRFGKFREPMLHYTGTLRGLGCTRNLVNPDGNPGTAVTQHPFGASSVFSFYLSSDRAPGSNLLAPEQKLINANELTNRLNTLSWKLETVPANATACDVDTFAQAFDESPQKLVDLINLRWFRGAMPPTLRSNLLQLATSQGNLGSARQAALTLTLYALTTPFYGIIQ
jgi:uncharacterized protein (DUF1800 family)